MFCVALLVCIPWLQVVQFNVVTILHNWQRGELGSWQFTAASVHSIQISKTGYVTHSDRELLHCESHHSRRGQRRAILLSICGPATYQLIRSLVAPSKPTEKTYAQLLQLVPPSQTAYYRLAITCGLANPRSRLAISSPPFVNCRNTATSVTPSTKCFSTASFADVVTVVYSVNYSQREMISPSTDC